MLFITLCYHYFVNNVQNTFSFELAQHWMKERGISCMALSVEFIYLTAPVARKWIKERGITHFTQLWGTTKSPILVFKFAYGGEFTSRRRRVGVGEFASRRVDRVPFGSTSPYVFKYPITSVNHQELEDSLAFVLVYCFVKPC